MSVERNRDGTVKTGSKLNPYGSAAPAKRIWIEFQKSVEQNLPHLLEVFWKGFSDEGKGYLPTKEQYLESDKSLETFGRFQPKNVDEDGSNSSFDIYKYRDALQGNIERQLKIEELELRYRDSLEDNIKNQRRIEELEAKISLIEQKQA